MLLAKHVFKQTIIFIWLSTIIVLLCAVTIPTAIFPSGWETKWTTYASVGVWLVNKRYILFSGCSVWDTPEGGVSHVQQTCIRQVQWDTVYPKPASQSQAPGVCHAPRSDKETTESSPGGEQCCQMYFPWSSGRAASEMTIYSLHTYFWPEPYGPWSKAVQYIWTRV